MQPALENIAFLSFSRVSCLAPKRMTAKAGRYDFVELRFNVVKPLFPRIRHKLEFACTFNGSCKYILYSSNSISSEKRSTRGSTHKRQLLIFCPRRGTSKLLSEQVANIYSGIYLCVGSLVRFYRLFYVLTSHWAEIPKLRLKSESSSSAKYSFMKPPHASIPHAPESGISCFG